MRYMDRLLTSRIAIGLLGPMSYVASLCISVGTYHTLIDQDFIQQLAPNVSTQGQSRRCHTSQMRRSTGSMAAAVYQAQPCNTVVIIESAVVLCIHFLSFSRSVDAVGAAGCMV